MPVLVSRVAALLLASALLGGCNIVVSKVPMYSAADQVGAPSLRPGLWVGEKDDCHFDESGALAKWPDCAEPLIISPSEVHGVGDKAGKPAPYVLAAGDPLVLQAQADVEVDASADASAGGNATASAAASASVETKGPPPYLFLGVHPLKLDSEGRIIRMEQWPVMCGPPPPEPKADAPPAEGRYVTRQPLPGLKVDGDVCTPDSKAAITNAARETRAYSQVQTAHWVRDTDR